MGGFLLPKLLIFCNDFYATCSEFWSADAAQIIWENWRLNSEKLRPKRSPIAECMHAGLVTLWDNYELNYASGIMGGLNQNIRVNAVDIFQK